MTEPDNREPYIVAIERGWPNIKTVYRICWHWLYAAWDTHWLGRSDHWIHGGRGNQRYYRTFTTRAGAERALVESRVTE
jgi:hypothetical protein